MMLNNLECELLNNYQRDFPLTSRPFAVLARELGTVESTVIALLRRFARSGVVSRVGPVFRPNTVGVSTLAAASVPERNLIATADCVNSFAEVNHNYEREHHLNLWFVINTATRERLDVVLCEIERRTGHQVISLPLIRDYYIDLGFELDFGNGRRPGHKMNSAKSKACMSRKSEWRGCGDLIAALQAGLPLEHKPYAAIAERAGLTEEALIALIGNMQNAGVIKRFGVVVRHHELGYRANAMCVWDVADERVDELGERMANLPFVNLCYRRKRCSPAWPYNLFCMVHGKERDRVLGRMEQLNRDLRLLALPRAVLFSARRFKQRGALYRVDESIDNERTAYG